MEGTLTESVRQRTGKCRVGPVVISSSFRDDPNSQLILFHPDKTTGIRKCGSGMGEDLGPDPLCWISLVGEGNGEVGCQTFALRLVTRTHQNPKGMILSRQGERGIWVPRSVWELEPRKGLCLMDSLTNFRGPFVVKYLVLLICTVYYNRV